ncbi:MAG: hypothetical protein A2Y10_15580 [Planctomycetes bacterium GWF2_41_51]|nr:MAG: hypothetical protein A2Y10_15580 [Planctomycetes bacterium GWF2_41_51]
MNKTKKQHYVPQFLLKKFAIKSGRKAQVWVMDKELNNFFISPTKDIAHENKFYDGFNENHNIPHMEDLLKKVDGTGANSINKILINKNLQLSDDEKYNLALFIAVQIVRTSSLQKEFAAMREYIVQHYGSDIQFGGDKKKVSEYSKEDDKQAALNCIVLFAQEFAEHLLTRRWFLCESPQNRNFILSDNPVVRDNMFDQRPYGNLGLLSPGIEIYLPLSPRSCLYIICPQLAQVVISGSLVESPLRDSFLTGLPIFMNNENVMRVNSLQVVFSERFIFSKSKSDFDIAIEMISKNPKLKKGLRAKIN